MAGRRSGKPKTAQCSTTPDAVVVPWCVTACRCSQLGGQEGLRRLVGSRLAIVLFLVLAGCKTYGPPPSCEYIRLHDASVSGMWTAAEETTSIPPPADEFWSQPQPLDVFLARALEQNPAVHAARHRIEAAMARVPQVSTLPDPMLAVTGWPFFPFIPQTAAGPMTVDVMVSQQVPWKGKLATRAAAASEEVQAARAQLAAAELETVEQVKRAYYELQALQEMKRVVQEDRKTLQSLADIATVRYQANLASQHEVLRLQAEISNVDTELVRLDQEIAAARAEMARALHLAPDTPFLAVQDTRPWDLPQDLDALYRKAVAVRPELQAQLAEMQRGRYLVELARLEYFPDPEFRVGWTDMTTRRALSPVADGLDMVSIGVAVNLPINQVRRAGAVREAESNVVAAARQYDQLRDQTLQEVKRLFALAASQRDMAALLNDSIIPKTETAYQSALRGYQTGQVTFADMLAVWRELLRYHVARIRLEAQYRQSLASLERVVGGLDFAPVAEPVPPAAPDPEEN